jgi:hypothetical protein
MRFWAGQNSVKNVPRILCTKIVEFLLAFNSLVEDFPHVQVRNKNKRLDEPGAVSLLNLNLQ